MPLEIVLFLAAFLAVCVTMLVLLARSSARTAPRLLAWMLPLGIPLLLGYGYVLTQFPLDFRLWTGFAAIFVPYVAAFTLIELRKMQKEGLVFGGADICSFRETGASGRSCDTAVVRWGGARRCLTVTVTEDEVWVAPTFPFLLFGRIYGLAHRVPLLKIHLMERLAGKRANIRFEYTAPDGWCRCVELQLRNPTAFIDAVREGQWEGVR